MNFNNFFTPDTFDFFAKYLVAGYIVMIVRARFIVSERPKATEIIVEAVILSLINQLVFQLIIWPLPERAITLIGPRALFFAEVLVLSSLIGLILGANLSRGWNRAVLRRLSLPVIQPIQRAHDFAFGNNRQPGLVIVRYADGTCVYGYFGPASLAASDTNRSDLFLERLYSVDEAGQWSETQPLRGALISLTDVRSIEFLESEGGE